MAESESEGEGKYEIFENHELGQACDPTVNPCPCGARWDWLIEWSDGKKLYFTEGIRRRYAALYGENPDHKRAVD